MTELPIAYRYEYVSGFFVLRDEGTAGEGSDVQVILFNRGDTDQRARILIVGVVSIANLETQTFFDDTVLVPPLSMVYPALGIWSPRTVDEAHGGYWARIVVSSLDVVPTVAVQNKAASDTDDQLTRFDNYFAPGDFAVFDVKAPTVVDPTAPLKPAK